MYNPLDASLLCLFWPGPFMITYIAEFSRKQKLILYFIYHALIYIFLGLYIYFLLGLSIANTICIAIINKHMLL